MSTIKSTFTAGISIKETFTPAELPAAGSNVPITSSAFNKSFDIAPDSIPPGSQKAILTPTLVAGALTIDFTNLPKSVGGTFSAAGLKLRAILFNNPGSNTVTISPGAATPYQFAGANSHPVYPGATWVEYFKDGLAAIDGTHKMIDLAGTGTDAFECVLVFG